MKKFLLGLIVGFLLATAVGATASQNIRLIINGKEIKTDVPPQLINGRVMVPARFVAEPLGATVEWDEVNRAVMIATTKPSANELKETWQNTWPSKYYPGGGVIRAILKKYPNLKQSSSNLKTEPQPGEYRFIPETGELWIDGQKFILPKQIVDNRLYFSIDPLLKSNILTEADIHLIQ